mmetsp:Transcript_33420/g.73099  ORF Transcript_33420/g.73099 Transcript_33420/m.73099 type:complete len:293 (-) Transcript_33420:117-995(-)
MFSVWSPEGRLAGEHHICDHPQAPEVAGCRIRFHILRCDDFRSRVCETSDGGFHRAAEEGHGEPPVDDLDVIIPGLFRAEDDVLRLHITMSYPSLVRVHQGCGNLSDDVRRQCLPDHSLINDTVEKFTAFAELHDEVHVGPLLERRQQFADIWMVQLLHHRNLPLYSFSVVVLVRCFGNLLDGHQAVCKLLVLRYEDLAISALTQRHLVNIIPLSDVNVKPFGQQLPVVNLPRTGFFVLHDPGHKLLILDASVTIGVYAVQELIRSRCGEFFRVQLGQNFLEFLLLNDAITI